jgi:hypothetical protein
MKRTNCLPGWQASHKGAGKRSELILSIASFKRSHASSRTCRPDCLLSFASLRQCHQQLPTPRTAPRMDRSRASFPAFGQSCRPPTSGSLSTTPRRLQPRAPVAVLRPAIARSTGTRKGRTGGRPRCRPRTLTCWSGPCGSRWRGSAPLCPGGGCRSTRAKRASARLSESAQSEAISASCECRSACAAASWILRIYSPTRQGSIVRHRGSAANGRATLVGNDAAMKTTFVTPLRHLLLLETTTSQTSFQDFN